MQLTVMPSAAPSFTLSGHKSTRIAFGRDDRDAEENMALTWREGRIDNAVKVRQGNSWQHKVAKGLLGFLALSVAMTVGAVLGFQQGQSELPPPKSNFRSAPSKTAPGDLPPQVVFPQWENPRFNNPNRPLWNNNNPQEWPPFNPKDFPELRGPKPDQPQRPDPKDTK
jgi:hypothetical protein